jgi:PhoH-like ATPase
VLLSERGSGLGRVRPDKSVRLVRGDREAFGVHGRSAEQRVAIDLLLDPEVGIVSLGGRAGTGKSALALCAGLESVLERRAHKKVIVFRPLYAVGGQDLGYLPGDSAEKMGPVGAGRLRHPRRAGQPGRRRGGAGARPARGAAAHPHPRPVAARRVRRRRRGAVARARGAAHGALAPGPGLARGAHARRRPARQPAGRPARRRRAVIEALRGHPLFAHVTLTRSERSPIAALVTEMLEDLPL